jgi:pimeloyl-ACP methyl ester carboxylesterase
MAEFVVDGGINRIRPGTGEGDYFSHPRLYTPDGTCRGAMYSHGAGGSGVGLHKGLTGAMGEALLGHAICGRYATCSADWGGLVHWGADLSIAALEAGYDQLIARGAAVAPMVHIGASMGNINTLRYAWKHPNRVAAYVGIIPSLDTQQIRDLIPSSRADQDAAYGIVYPAPIPAESGGVPLNPFTFADELECPILVLAASNDAIVSFATAQAFVAAAQSGASGDATLINLGALGHTDAAMVAAVPHIEAWLKAKVSSLL